MNMNASPWGNGSRFSPTGISFVQFPEVEEEARVNSVPLEVKTIDRKSISNDPKHQHRLIVEKASRENIEAIKDWLRFGRNEIKRLLVVDYGNGNYGLYDGNHRFQACCELKIPKLECYVMPAGTEHNIAETIASNVNERHGTRLAPQARIELAYSDWKRGIIAQIPDTDQYRKMVADSHAVIKKHLDDRIEVGIVDDWLAKMNVGNPGFRSPDIKRTVVSAYMDMLAVSTMSVDQRKDDLRKLGDIIAGSMKIRGITVSKVIDAWRDSVTRSKLNQTNVLDEFREKLKTSEHEVRVIRTPPPGKRLPVTFRDSINQTHALCLEYMRIAELADGNEKTEIVHRLRALVEAAETVIGSKEFEVPFFGQVAR